MSSVHHRVRGNFISALRDLVPAMAVEPHQPAATKHPERPAKALAKPPPKRRHKRHINDHLADKPR